MAQELITIHLSHLNFGNYIFPGQSQHISRKEARSAAFRISGEAGRQIHITFQLPNTLNQQADEGLNILFSSTDGGYHSRESMQSNAIAFDPTNGLITTLDSDGTLYIWIGATIHPYKIQPGGSYNANITINASYTTQ